MSCRLSLILVFVVLMAAGSAWPQTAAEYAGTTSKLGAAGVGAKTVMQIPSRAFAQPSRKLRSAHLVARTDETPEDVINRRTLAQSAGKDAALLDLRSRPEGAQVWMDGKWVGHTPVSLNLTPGPHRLEMQATRMEDVAQTITLSPQEIRGLELVLVPRYPTEVRLR